MQGALSRTDASKQSTPKKTQTAKVTTEKGWTWGRRGKKLPGLEAKTTGRSGLAKQAFQSVRDVCATKNTPRPEYRLSIGGKGVGFPRGCQPRSTPGTPNDAGRMRGARGLRRGCSNDVRVVLQIFGTQVAKKAEQGEGALTQSKKEGAHDKRKQQRVEELPTGFPEPSVNAADGCESWKTQQVRK